MAQQLIDVGTVANDRTGDTWRAAFQKVNSNETELFDRELERQKIVNKLADLPAAIAGVITLAANTQYLQGQDFSLGTDRIVMGSNTSYSAIESIVVTLTYTGTGDMFTILNTRNRISNLGISCVSGRVINFSDNTDSIFRMNDCSIACDRFGLFNSSGANGSTVRFTNVSPSSITTSGITTTGSWNTWLWETSAVNITGGAVFDFGIATFNEIILDLILANLGAGTNLIKGAAASANINTGGIGAVTRMLTSGAGTPLSGVTVDDIRWVFRNNDDIKDTQQDALINFKGNATVTTIAASSTDGSNAVLVAGAFTEQRASHFTTTAAGRITYIGERDLVTPIDVIATVDPAGDADFAIYIALNGTAIDPTGLGQFVKSTDAETLTTSWQLNLSTNDFIEPFVENQTTTDNVTVKNIIFRVR